MRRGNESKPYSDFMAGNEKNNAVVASGFLWSYLGSASVETSAVLLGSYLGSFLGSASVEVYWSSIEVLYGVCEC